MSFRFLFASPCKVGSSRLRAATESALIDAQRQTMQQTFSDNFGFFGDFSLARCNHFRYEGTQVKDGNYCKVQRLQLSLSLVNYYLVESRGTVGEEEAATLDDAVRKREAEVGSEELLDVGTTDIDGLLDLSDAEDLSKGGKIRLVCDFRIRTGVTDLNRAEAGTVTSSHILVAGVDSVGTGELTVLLVHVVGTGARVVTKPDTEVLDLEGLLLADLLRGREGETNESQSSAIDREVSPMFIDDSILSECTSNPHCFLSSFSRLEICPLPSHE